MEEVSTWYFVLSNGYWLRTRGPATYYLITHYPLPTTHYLLTNSPRPITTRGTLKGEHARHLVITFEPTAPSAVARPSRARRGPDGDALRIHRRDRLHHPRRRAA